MATKTSSTGTSSTKPTTKKGVSQENGKSPVSSAETKKSVNQSDEFLAVAPHVLMTSEIKFKDLAKKQMSVDWDGREIRIVNLVPKHLRETSEIMSLKEYAEVSGIRAQHIENGCTPYIDPGLLTGSIEISKQEILEKKSPLSIWRPHSDTEVELWEVNEMSLPSGAK
jgi:hypothetical protein